MSDGILPALLVIVVVWKPVNDVLINSVQSYSSFRRCIYRHCDQGNVRIRGFRSCCSTNPVHWSFVVKTVRHGTVELQIMFKQTWCFQTRIFLDGTSSQAQLVLVNIRVAEISFLRETQVVEWREAMHRTQFVVWTELPEMIHCCKQIQKQPTVKFFQCKQQTALSVINLIPQILQPRVSYSKNIDLIQTAVNLRAYPIHLESYRRWLGWKVPRLIIQPMWKSLRSIRTFAFVNLGRWCKVPGLIIHSIYVYEVDYLLRSLILVILSRMQRDAPSTESENKLQQWAITLSNISSSSPSSVSSSSLQSSRYSTVTSDRSLFSLSPVSTNWTIKTQRVGTWQPSSTPAPRFVCLQRCLYCRVLNAYTETIMCFCYDSDRLMQS